MQKSLETQSNYLTLLSGLNRVVNLLAGFCFLLSVSRSVPWGLIEAVRAIGKASSTDRLIPLRLRKLPFKIEV